MSQAFTLELLLLVALSLNAYPKNNIGKANAGSGNAPSVAVVPATRGGASANMNERKFYAWINLLAIFISV